jgi:hypothetical protein
MNLSDIAHRRLASQQIAGTEFKTAQEVVTWLGAMQAQDYAMAKWALGVRLPGSTDAGIEAALNAGEIVRTHLLRPTWQFVSAADVYWLLALTAPHIRAALKSRHADLGLSEAVVAKSNAIFEKALSGGKQLGREALIAGLAQAKLATDDNRASHFLLRAELDGIVCSGVARRGKPVYALLEEKVPRPKPLTREEALARLARRYFTGHGPATLADFVWWSGLPAGEARRALEAVKAELVSETLAAQTYWSAEAALRPGKKGLYLLPAFDEYLISYKDRSAMLPAENFRRTVSSNGIFRPIIVDHGQVTGLWKRTTKKDTVTVETELLGPLTQTAEGLVEKAVLRYGQFLGKKTALNHAG